MLVAAVILCTAGGNFFSLFKHYTKSMEISNTLRTELLYVTEIPLLGI